MLIQKRLVKFSKEQEKLFVQERNTISRYRWTYFRTLRKTQSIFENEWKMVKSRKFYDQQWYLISFAEDEEENKVSGAASNMPMAEWHCWMIFFWLPFFFREVTAVWLLPLDPVAICYPTAKSGWSQWVKNGFCDLAFTFCPRAAALHHQKQTLVGTRPPALEDTWQIHTEAIWMYIYFWIPCGPPSIMNRFWSNRSWSSATI